MFTDDTLTTLTQAGISEFHANLYASALGTTDADTIVALHAAGISSGDAHSYAAYGLSPADMTAFSAAGATPYWTELARYIGVLTVDAAAALSQLPGADAHTLDFIELARRACVRSGVPAVERVLIAAARLGRLPAGMLTALSRPSGLPDDIAAASDTQLTAAITLTEDHFVRDHSISTAHIRESLTMFP